MVGGALAVPGALAACGKDGESPSQEPIGPTAAGQAGSLQELVNERIRQGAKQGLSVFLAGGDFAVGISNYVGLGLVVQGAPIANGAAQVWMAPTTDAKAAVTPLGPFPAPWLGYSKPQQNGPPGINAADLRFDKTGKWGTLVEVITPTAKLLGTTAIEVKPKPTNKAPGDKANPSQTPTVDDQRGVNPICTRTPPCPFHQINLASALRSGKPVAFLMGTPRFCESRTCGPNLDELIAVSEDIGDRATFIHVEVYKDDKDAPANEVVSPTFLEWKFTSEPWIYLIDRSGSIAHRYEGPVTATRLRKDLSPLLG